MRHGYGQVYYHLIVGSWLPNLDNLVADILCELGLRSRKTLGRILEGNLALRLCLILLAKPCTEGCDVYNLLLAPLKDLLALSNGGGVVEVDDGVLCTLDSLKGFRDYVLTRLGENLNGNVVGDKPLFNYRTAEFILRFARRREADLNLLKADLAKKLEELKLFIKAHRDYESLVSVAKVDAAPPRRLFYIFLLRPAHFNAARREELLFIFRVAFHFLSS